MEYKIAICSHDRIKTLKQKTLKVLDLYNISRERIYIFVAPEELEDYRANLLGYNVIEGALGLCANRNAVVNYFAEGTPVYFMDDDIRGYMEYTLDNQRHERMLEDLDGFICRGFREALKADVSLWGLYPVANGRWMKPEVVKGLVFCYGCSFGLFIRKDTLNTISFKEDYERTILFYLRDKGVIRLNWVAPLQSYCKGKGGLNTERTLDKEKAECENLTQQYPGYLTMSFNRGKWNLRFKKQKATDE